jgi:hypothetical protein
MLKSLWLDEGGAVLSAELILLTVILVIGVSVGMVAVRDAVDAQFVELALSIAAVDTSFGFDGITYDETLGGTGGTAFVSDTLRLATFNEFGGTEVSDVLTGVDATEDKGDTSF